MPLSCHNETMEAERIQKLLARAGYGSRRQIERWIEAGAVIVNGKQASLGGKITDQDEVILRGQKLRLSSKLNAVTKVLLYHKRVGEICTRDDPGGRKTIYDDLPELKPGRWISVGRLDINTDGLMLFTNDGELANKLMHPSSEIEREYAVRVLGTVTDDMLKTLKNGVMLEDGMGSFDSIRYVGGEGANRWYHVILKEGRNREVRRLWESQGVTVSRLRRVRYGNISLERSLRSGQSEELSTRRMHKLYESVGLKFEEGDVKLEDSKERYSDRDKPTKRGNSPHSSNDSRDSRKGAWSKQGKGKFNRKKKNSGKGPWNNQ